MEEYFLKLTPANRKGNVDFTAIAKEKVNGIPIFEYAEKYVNQTDNFQKKKKQLHIMEITPEYLIIKLYSVSKLEMVSKSLAGFSRELLRVDEQRKARNEQSLFDNVEYNHGLFRSEVIRGKEEIAETAPKLSDSAALKLLIDLLYGEPIKTKEDGKRRTAVIFAIKEILTDYFKNIPK